MEIILKYITIPHSVIETNVLLCSELPIGTPLQYSCLENLMDGGGWWAAVHGVAKSRTRLSDFTFTFHFHALEKEMATHSSVLTWRIPGTEGPSRRPSVGSHRVGHDWSDLAVAAAYPCTNIKVPKPHHQILIPYSIGLQRGAGFCTLPLPHAWKLCQKGINTERYRMLLWCRPLTVNLACGTVM